MRTKLAAAKPGSSSPSTSSTWRLGRGLHMEAPKKEQEGETQRRSWTDLLAGSFRGKEKRTHRVAEILEGTVLGPSSSASTGESGRNGELQLTTRMAGALLLAGWISYGTLASRPISASTKQELTTEQGGKWQGTEDQARKVSERQAAEDQQRGSCRSKEERED